MTVTTTRCYSDCNCSNVTATMIITVTINITTTVPVTITIVITIIVAVTVTVSTNNATLFLSFMPTFEHYYGNYRVACGIFSSILLVE